MLSSIVHAIPLELAGSRFTVESFERLLSFCVEHLVSHNILMQCLIIHIPSAPLNILRPTMSNAGRTKILTIKIEEACRRP